MVNRTNISLDDSLLATTNGLMARLNALPFPVKLAWRLSNASAEGAVQGREVVDRRTNVQWAGVRKE